MTSFGALVILLFKVTFYHATGSPMANGQMPYPGAAACSTHFDLGTVIGLVGPDGWYPVVCADRGHINSRPWVDIYCPDRACGRYVASAFIGETYGVVVEPRE